MKKTKFGEDDDQQIFVTIYVVNISIVGFWEYIRWRYATKDHCSIDSDLDSRFITLVSRRFLLGPTIYLIAVVISFVSIQLTCTVYNYSSLFYNIG